MSYFSETVHDSLGHLEEVQMNLLAGAETLRTGAVYEAGEGIRVTPEFLERQAKAISFVIKNIEKAWDT